MANIEKIQVDGTAYDVRDASLAGGSSGQYLTKSSATSYAYTWKTLSVASGNIATGAVTSAKLGSGAVTSGKIGSGAVSYANLAAAAVTEILKKVYPLGSVYANYSDSTNPATLLGFGTWVAIGGKFLLGADAAYTAGSTGGEAEHTLTVDEMPKHRHSYTAPSRNSGSEWIGEYGTGASQSLNSDYTGGGAAHNNMPPYTAVYLWRRTA